jgi:hypothetical protein
MQVDEDAETLRSALRVERLRFEDITVGRLSALRKRRFCDGFGFGAGWRFQDWKFYCWREEALGLIAPWPNGLADYRCKDVSD